MLKSILFFIISVLLIHSESNIKAQGFTFTNLGPNYVQYPYYPDSVQVVKHQSIVRNTSGSNLNFRFARIVNDLPIGWETQMCYDLCYAPFIDTISMPSDPPYLMAPGHQDTLFYIDFTCSGQGLGTAVVRMYNTDNPALYVQDTFKVQIGNVGINPVSTFAESYSLSQNYPNPFNPNTKINFSIPNLETVSLKVYNILGFEVASLINNEKLLKGNYNIEFNANGSGKGLASGIYYYTLRTERYSDTKKMLLIK